MESDFEPVSSLSEETSGLDKDFNFDFAAFLVVSSESVCVSRKQTKRNNGFKVREFEETRRM